MFILVPNSVHAVVTSTSQMNRAAKTAPFVVLTTMSKVIFSPVLSCFYALFNILFGELSRNINGLFNLHGSSMDAKVGGSTFAYILSS
jgi:hypothetical protein